MVDLDLEKILQKKSSINLLAYRGPIVWDPNAPPKNNMKMETHHI